MKLRAPDASFSLTHAGQTYTAQPDRSLDIPPDLINIFRSHGCDDWVGLTEPCEPCDIRDQDKPEAQILALRHDQFSSMNRSDLFSWLGEHGVKIRPPVGLAELRQACREKATALAAKDKMRLAFEEKVAAGLVRTPGSDQTD